MAVSFGIISRAGCGKCLRAIFFKSFCMLFILCCLSARSHTLPIGYLRLSAEADYLHLELIFNPFELTFISEVDENKDGELSSGEVKKHGTNIVNRVSGSMRVLVSGKAVPAENAGMDPDMTGHHVRLRVHYKVDARKAPVTLVSEMESITSASHLTQVTFSDGESSQLGQLDSRSKEVTFNAAAAKQDKVETKSQSQPPLKHE